MWIWNSFGWLSFIILRIYVCAYFPLSQLNTDHFQINFDNINQRKKHSVLVTYTSIHVDTDPIVFLRELKIPLFPFFPFSVRNCGCQSSWESNQNVYISNAQGEKCKFLLENLLPLFALQKNKRTKKTILECQKSSIFIIFLWSLKDFVATWYYRKKTRDPNWGWSIFVGCIIKSYFQEMNFCFSTPPIKTLHLL